MSATFQKFSVGKGAQSLEVSPERKTYSKVTLVLAKDEQGNERTVSAGNDTAEEMIIDAPACTDSATAQSAATYILGTLNGFKYQPYEASGTMLDPVAELGDAVGINTEYSGVYNRRIKFGRLMASDMSAPQQEDVDHEYGGLEKAQNRKFERITGSLYAGIAVQADRITAEVSRAEAAESSLSSSITQTATDITSEVSRATAAEGTLRSSIQQTATQVSAKVDATGGSSSSFGWSLTASGFTLNSGGTTVMQVDRNGATVKGIIQATAGLIGGFTIGSNALYNGISSFNDDTTTTGVYLGTDGIKLGRNFSVNRTGNVTAHNMTLTGQLKIGDSSIDANALRKGAKSAFDNGSRWTTGSGYGEQFHDSCESERTRVDKFYCGTLYCHAFKADTVDLSTGIRTNSLEITGNTNTGLTFSSNATGTKAAHIKFLNTSCWIQVDKTHLKPQQIDVRLADGTTKKVKGFFALS